MRKYDSQNTQDRASAIDATLYLLQSGLTDGVALLCEHFADETVRIIDSHPSISWGGSLLHLPRGLLGDVPLVQQVGDTRISTGWTMACGARPLWLASAPVSGHKLYVLAASTHTKSINPAQMEMAALTLAHLLTEGQQSRIEKDASRRVNALIRYLPDPIIFVQKDGFSIFINNQARALLELKQDDDPIKHVPMALSDLLQNGDPDSQSFQLLSDAQGSMEFEIQKGDQYFRVHSVWVEEDALSGRLWMFSDVTHERRLQRRLTALANKDGLTGLLNRRAFDICLDRELERARQSHSSLCIVVLDLDHFKLINDTFGHHAGDLILQNVARAIQNFARAGDVIARIGGEELAVVFPETEMNDAMEVAERFRIAVSQVAVVQQQEVIKVTCSIGGAEYRASVDTVETLMTRADQALYRAKGLGRNRVEFYSRLP